MNKKIIIEIQDIAKEQVLEQILSKYTFLHGGFPRIARRAIYEPVILTIRLQQNNGIPMIILGLDLINNKRQYLNADYQEHTVESLIKLLSEHCQIFNDLIPGNYFIDHNSYIVKIFKVHNTRGDLVLEDAYGVLYRWNNITFIPSIRQVKLQTQISGTNIYIHRDGLNTQFIFMKADSNPIPVCVIPWAELETFCNNLKLMRKYATENVYFIGLFTKGNITTKVKFSSEILKNILDECRWIEQTAKNGGI